MHSLLAFIAASTTPTTKPAKGSSSSSLTFLIIIGLFVLVYFLFIRPRTQRMRQQQSSSKQLSVGDSVMSAGGIYGTIVALDSDVVEVEVSPGVVMQFTPRAISLRPGTTSKGSAAATPAPVVDDEWDTPPAVSDETPAIDPSPPADSHPEGESGGPDERPGPAV